MSNLQLVPIYDLETMLLNLELIQYLTPSLTLQSYQAHLMQMIPHNYAQLNAVLDGKTIAVSGYWIGTKLYCGKYLEIDNFIVEPTYRNQQIGEMMVNWLSQKAIEEKCNVIMLDAYKENQKAHQFYEKHGFSAKGFHFIKKL